MRKSSGQTLVEMVVAVGMVSLVLVAIVSGIAISIRNSRFSKNKALATRYAQEGVEKFRFYRDEYGWEPFFEAMQSGGENYCFADFPNSLEVVLDPEEAYSGSCTSETINDDEVYTRYAQVSVNTLPSNWVDVVIGVSWYEGAVPHSVELTTRFNDWTRK